MTTLLRIFIEIDFNFALIIYYWYVYSGSINKQNFAKFSHTYNFVSYVERWHD